MERCSFKDHQIKSANSKYRDQTIKIIYHSSQLWMINPEPECRFLLTHPFLHNLQQETLLNIQDPTNNLKYFSILFNISKMILRPSKTTEVLLRY